jgi:U32 family peptidase
MNAPELLAPAGDADCIRAAIENGADAVYFGLDDGFNARVRATNFSLQTLPETIRGLHRRGVRGYVTLNTLVFSDELEAFQRAVRAIAASGVDAVLVQDLGAARLIRAICPQLPIHASTQMSLTSSQCIAEASKLGVERVVLARELSVDEIRMIRSQTDMPLEVFVHGALCVAYSGQCLTSEALGGRSANRGQCAQACRLPYQLIVDGKPRDLGSQQYLLSPQDLAAIDLIPSLIDAGVCSLKIEGRLKSPEYVANITGHYRRAIDAAMAGTPRPISREDQQEMELSFSRGFSHGWLDGNDHKVLVPGLSSAKRGIFLGTVRGTKQGWIAVDLAASVARGDGLVFEGDRIAGTETGGRIYDVRIQGRSTDQTILQGRVELKFAPGAIAFEHIGLGQRVWKTDDPQLSKRLRKTFETSQPQRRSPVAFNVNAAVGQPLRIVATLPGSQTVEHTSSDSLATATKHPIDESTLREQLGRLGGTPFELRSLHATIEGSPMVPLSVLGAARRALVEQLTAAAESLPVRSVDETNVVTRMRALLPHRTEKAVTSDPQLWVMCRSMTQLQRVLALRPDGVYVDFHDIREYRQAVADARAIGVPIFVSSVRIQKPDEYGLLRVVLKSQPDGLLARNLAALRFAVDQGIEAIADFSLNCANELTAQHLIDQGASHVVASFDLNRQQLLGMAGHVPPQWLEVVLHQHMAMFHMEHCVFCSVLSPGTNKTNCGRPCDRHVVHLTDRVGKPHLLVADIGCRNTLFNATPQSGAALARELQVLGVRRFRIELLEDSAARIDQVVTLYRQLLDGKVAGQQVWETLRADNRVGITRGTNET